ncbi:LuxR C-terminal-related transcriptional regulator [Ramlibacter sp. XY19]|uniref:helix-turn-helix transcriptional regulator n=1 Tax=Ramlibacter paludis TaxID=2908000 RepID=UPI0023DAACD7|nr:LuxR C-terminal-related transcriptional regulator [Ramlibacter paludis]MCG2591609.1 LuxR C-terminal-related transcriptional regulator [Ramlibacter paludis]
MNHLATTSPLGVGHLRAAHERVGGALAMLLDELAHGVVLASSEGRLLLANQAARQVLSRGQPLAVQEGYLQAHDPKQTRVLRQALAKGGAGKRSLVSLRCPAGWGLSVAVVPLRGEGPARAPTLGLFLSRTSVCDSLMLCFFARSHGLTHSEEQVLAILCQGCSAPEVAVQLKVAVSTVRSHIRSLCAKTQSSGVRMLVGRVAVLPPLGSPLHHPVH